MDIRWFDNKSWAKESAHLIQKSIDEFVAINKNSSVNIMLTGGSSAELVYKEWSELKEFQNSIGLNFYITDERCVPVGHAHSNSYMIINSLFGNKNSHHLNNFYLIDASQKNIDKARMDYDNLLPNVIDVLILSVGKDGHVASIFPNNGFDNGVHKVMITSSENHPYKRLSITPGVIDSAKKVFVLANGEEKLKILKKVMLCSSCNIFLPAVIARNGTWLADINL